MIQIPKATKIIMTLSLLIPIVTLVSPHLIKYMYYDIRFLKTLQLHRPILSIFLSSVDINLVFKLLLRYQTLTTLENGNLRIDNIDTQIELLYFTLTFVIPLFFANLSEGIVTFSESIDMAYVKLMCDLMPRGSMISFFNFNIDSSYFVYYYFFYELAMSKLRSKCYYGLVYAACYVYFRRNLGGVPDIFVAFVTFAEKKGVELFNAIKNGKICVKPKTGRTLKSYRKNK